MEKADLRTTFYANHHPYTEGLLLSLPGYGGERERLQPIPGQPPSLINLPPGCPFHPRCPYVMDRCLTEDPPLAGGRRTTSAHLSACWLPHDDGRARRGAAQGRGRAAAGAGGRARGWRDEREHQQPRRRTRDADADVLLRVENMVKHFPVQSRQLCPADKEFVHAVDGVEPGGTPRARPSGLVGETGCGKSTLARCVARLYDLTSGTDHLRRPATSAPLAAARCARSGARCR